MNFNKAIVVGNLTRDPQNKTLPSGQTVASFSVATNRAWTDQGGNKQEAVEFHNIVAFGKLAEICSRYLNKGRLVLIEGRLRTSSWQDQSGIKHYRTEIIAENMQMGPRPESVSSSGGQNSANVSQSGANQKDIPVIDVGEPASPEENAMANGAMTNNQDTAIQQSPENQSDVVDVENIPF